MVTFDLRGHVNLDPAESQIAEALAGASRADVTWQDVYENCTFACAAMTMIDYGYGDPLAPEQWREIATPGSHGGESWQATTDVIAARPDLYPAPPPMSIAWPGDVAQAMRDYGAKGWMTHFAGWCTPSAEWTPGDWNGGISHAGRIIYADEAGLALWNPWTGYPVYQPDSFWRSAYDGGGLLVFERPLVTFGAAQLAQEARDTMRFINFWNQLHAFWVTSSGELRNAWYDPAHGDLGWQVATRASGVRPNSVPDVAATSWDGQQLHVSVPTPDDKMLHVWVQGGQPDWYAQVVG